MSQERRGGEGLREWKCRQLVVAAAGLLLAAACGGGPARSHLEMIIRTILRSWQVAGSRNVKAW
jgi:hypothetical protein